MWIAGQFGLPPIVPINIQGEAFPIVWSIIGSALLTAILGLLFRRRRVI
jgi:LPXTG-motif cell wall-anchored protein